MPERWLTRVLLVHGRHDRPIPIAAAKRAHAWIQGSELRPLDCGQSPQVDEPEAVTDLVLGFAGRQNTAA